MSIASLLDLHVLSRTASAVCYSCNAKCVKTRFILEYRISSLFFKEEEIMLDVCSKNNIQLLYFSDSELLYKIIAIMQMDNTELNNSISINSYRGTDIRITINSTTYSINKVINNIYILKLNTYMIDNKNRLTNIINNLAKQKINKIHVYYLKDENSKNIIYNLIIHLCNINRVNELLYNDRMTRILED